METDYCISSLSEIERALQQFLFLHSNFFLFKVHGAVIASGQSHVNCSFLDLTFDKTVTVTESFYKPLSLREAVKKNNWIFFDIESISFVTFLPYLILTKYIMTFLSFFANYPPSSKYDIKQN